MTATQLSLPTCVLPGCITVVSDPTRPCDGCLSAFGEWLRESDRPAPPQAEVDESNDRYRRVMADRARMIAEREASADRQIAIAAGELRKPSQMCWMCEERRACTLVAGRWECDSCMDIS